MTFTFIVLFPSTILNGLVSVELESSRYSIVALPLFFVGFRVIRPFVTPPIEEQLTYWE